jgi:hypothetical protein
MVHWLRSASDADSGFYDTVDDLGGAFIYDGGATLDAQGVRFVNNVNGMRLDRIGVMACAQCHFEGNSQWDYKIDGLLWTDSLLNELKIDDYEEWKFLALEDVPDEIGKKSKRPGFKSLQQVCSIRCNSACTRSLHTENGSWHHLPHAYLLRL